MSLGSSFYNARKKSGLSQEEVAGRLGVSRQTISKWEQGLSVPDADMLISLSEAFETPVSTLLGETIVETKPDELRAVSEKLEVINLQLARRKAAGQKALRWFFLLLCTVTAAIFAVLVVLNSPYLGWDYSQPETTVIGVAFHAFEWLFVRTAPFVLIGSIVGVCLTWKQV